MSEEEMKKLEDEKLDQVAGGLKSDYEIACEVIEGYWGNGDERIRRLSAAGYNPYAIQSMVNRMLADGYDDLLDRGLRFAFSSRLGYLNQDPLNIGTGMRASVLLHLPALSKNGTLTTLASTAGKLGFSLRIFVFTVFPQVVFHPIQ